MEADRSATPGRVQRRRYDAKFKRALVEQTLVPGASVARIAREHGINANQLFKWRRQQLLEERGQGAGAGQPPSMSLIPVTVLEQEPQAPRTPDPKPAPGRIEITLGVGKVVVQGAVDAGTLRVVLESLRR